MLINNYNNVLNEVNLACDKAGRAKDEVTLIDTITCIINYQYLSTNTGE